MSLIMGQIESENWELFALEFGKIGHNTYAHEGSYEFDCGSN